MRTRSFLVDNTLGKLFTNTAASSLANSSNVIAGTKIQTKTISQGNLVIGKAVNGLSLGTLGASGLLVGVSVSSFALGTSTPYQDSIFKIKYGTTGYANATELLNTDPTVGYKWVLPYTSNVVTYPKISGTYPIAFNWSNNEIFYVDITQVTRNVKGLSLTLTYYLG